MDYYVVVLRSDKFEHNYFGFSSDVERRIIQHNTGHTKSTKPYRPWRLLFAEAYSSKNEAIEREKFLKSGQGREYIKKVLAS